MSNVNKYHIYIFPQPMTTSHPFRTTSYPQNTECFTSADRLASINRVIILVILLPHGNNITRRYLINTHGYDEPVKI